MKTRWLVIIRKKKAIVLDPIRRNFTHFIFRYIRSPTKILKNHWGKLRINNNIFKGTGSLPNEMKALKTTLGHSRPILGSRDYFLFCLVWYPQIHISWMQN